MKSILTVLLILNISLISAQNWTKVYEYNNSSTYTTSSIHNFQFIDSEIGFFSTVEYTSGSSGGVSDLYCTLNSGQDWTKIHSLSGDMGSSASLHFDFFDKNNSYIFESYGGGLYHGVILRDSVETSIGWTPYNTFIEYFSFDTVIISSYEIDNCLYILPRSEDILHKIEISEQYSYGYPNYSYYDQIKSASFGGGIGVAIGKNNNTNYIYTSDYQLENWTKDTLNISGNLNKVYFINENTGFIIANDSLLYRTSNNELEFSLVDLAFPFAFRIIDIQFNDSIGFILSDANIVAKSIDYGATWDIEFIDGASSLKRLSLVNESAFVVDGNNQIFTNFEITSTSYINKSDISVNYYPNPVIDILKIESDKNIDEVYIYNIKGQLVLSKTNIKNTNINLDIRKLPKGFYVSKIMKQGIEEEFPFIKQ